jgi:HK97 family phage portal protein
MALFKKKIPTPNTSTSPQLDQAFEKLVQDFPNRDFSASPATREIQRVVVQTLEALQSKQLEAIHSPYLTHSDRYLNDYGDRWLLRIPQTKIDYATAIGDPLKNSAVFAVINYICRTFPEAPLRVYRRDRHGTLQAEYDHPLELLLEQPNPSYDGVTLWMGTLISFLLSGNAYWLKYRNELGQLKELYYVPHFCIEPKWPDDGKTFISYYEFKPGNGQTYKILPEDIVHLRYGLDPENPRKGLSHLASVLREVFTDNEASSFGAALLKNMGVPSVIISPSSEDVTITREKAEAIKGRFKEAVTGDNRGEPLVMSAGVRINTVSLTPQQLDLKLLHRLPEERIAAIFGVPAIIAGLGAGLDRSSMSNFHEAREMAYESCIIPLQQILVRQLKRQLLGEFTVSIKGRVVDFDLSKVRVLQTDENQKAQRIDLAIRGGWMKRSEGRAAMNLPVSEEDNIYLGEGQIESDSLAQNTEEQGGNNANPNDPYGRSHRKKPLARGRKPDVNSQGQINVEAVRRARGIKSAAEFSPPDLDELIALDEREIDVAEKFWWNFTPNNELTSDNLRGVLKSIAERCQNVTAELEQQYWAHGLKAEELYDWLVKISFWLRISHITALACSQETWNITPEDYADFAQPIISGQIKVVATTAHDLAQGQKTLNQHFTSQMSALVSGAWATFNLNLIHPPSSRKVHHAA